MPHEDDSALNSRIHSAKTRLHKRLQKLDLKSLGITEYSQRYLGDKIDDLSGTLDLYGHLLALCFSNSSLPLQRSVFVDYGGGSGVLSYLAKELGIGKVIYIDIYKESCNDVEILSNALNLSLDHILYGDVDELISFVQENLITINSIASYDVLEHIYDVENHFKRLSSLGYQFRIVYASGANNENPRIVQALRRKQKLIEYQNRERAWGHKERDSLLAYHDLRKEIIAAYSPELDSDEIAQITERTRGLIVADIKKCIDEYRAKGYITYLNDHPTNTCDPYTGNWCEHLMRIEWLENILTKSGYTVDTMSGYYHLSSPTLKAFIARVLNTSIYLLGRRGLTIAPYFIICADHDH